MQTVSNEAIYSAIFQLQKVDLTVITPTACRNDYKMKSNWITGRMLCTYSEVSPVDLPVYSIVEIPMVACYRMRRMPVRETVEDLWFTETTRGRSMSWLVLCPGALDVREKDIQASSQSSPTFGRKTFT